MNSRTSRTLDRYLTTDPFDGLGPADLGTDRPIIDPEAQDAAERNARATDAEFDSLIRAMDSRVTALSMTDETYSALCALLYTGFQGDFGDIQYWASRAENAKTREDLGFSVRALTRAILLCGRI